MNKSALSIVLLLLLQLLSVPVYGHTKKDLISYLPEDCETIICAKEILPLSVKEIDTDLRHLFTLFSIRSEKHNFPKLRDVLRETTIDGMLHGSKKHGPNTVSDGFIDGSSFEGVELYNLVKPNIGNLSRVFNELASRKTVYRKNPVWFVNGIGDSSEATVFSIVKPNLLIYSTDIETLKQVVDRALLAKPKSELLNIPEYVSLPEDSVFFAIRHYRKSTRDPYSPIKNTKLSFIGDTEAIGFAISYSDYSMNNLQLQYYSKNPSMIIHLIDCMKAKAFYPTKKTFEYQISKRTANMYQFSISPYGEDGRLNLTFWFKGLLGFVPYGI